YLGYWGRRISGQYGTMQHKDKTGPQPPTRRINRDAETFVEYVYKIVTGILREKSTDREDRRAWKYHGGNVRNELPCFPSGFPVTYPLPVFFSAYLWKLSHVASSSAVRE